MTANRRDAMAAPEIKTKATIRTKEAVFAKVDGEMSVGSGYAFDMAVVRTQRVNLVGSEVLQY